MTYPEKLAQILEKHHIKSIFDCQTYASLKSDLVAFIKEEKRVSFNEGTHDGAAFESSRDRERTPTGQ